MEVKLNLKAKSGCVLERGHQGLFEYEIIFEEQKVEIPKKGIKHA